MPYRATVEIDLDRWLQGVPVIDNGDFEFFAWVNGVPLLNQADPISEDVFEPPPDLGGNMRRAFFF